MVRLEIVAIYAGVNILLLMVLLLLVVRQRQAHKIALGDGGNDRMNRAMRAHGNAAETIPAALIGLTILALLEPAAPTWLLHAGGLLLTAGRILHAIGLHSSAVNAGRFLGSLLTVLAFLIIGGGLIYAGLAQQV